MAGLRLSTWKLTLREARQERLKRPGLDQLLADARRHRFDVVLVAAFDRVARNVRHFLEVLDELNHLSIEFLSLRENIDTGGPLSRAMDRNRWSDCRIREKFNPLNACGRGCGERSWKEDGSAVRRLTLTGLLLCETASPVVRRKWRRSTESLWNLWAHLGDAQRDAAKEHAERIEKYSVQ